MQVGKLILGPTPFFQRAIHLYEQRGFGKNDSQTLNSGNHESATRGERLLAAAVTTCAETMATQNSYAYVLAVLGAHP